MADGLAVECLAGSSEKHKMSLQEGELGKIGFEN